MSPKIIPDGDILIHAGDLTNVGTLKEIKSVERWIGSLPHKHKVHDLGFTSCATTAEVATHSHTQTGNSQIIIAGNHDTSLEVAYYDKFWKLWHSKKRTTNTPTTSAAPLSTKLMCHRDAWPLGQRIAQLQGLYS